MELPLRRDLRPREGEPEDSAWIWGPNDELGRLNLQTAERVKNAMSEAIAGEVIPLNLRVDLPSPPCFKRPPFQHEIVRLAENAFDETYRLNPQISSQWDGFRHFAHAPTGYFYNGMVAEDIIDPGASSKCGMQAWASHGIVGRGILLDYGRYTELKGIQPEFYNNHNITYADLVKTAEMQNINLKRSDDGGDTEIGDILLIRSGFLKHAASLTELERERLHQRPSKPGPGDGQRYIGLEQSEEMLDFLHDSYFSAVAGDQPALEAWPSDKEYYLHEKLLALWGCPIRELWDLEKLGSRCADRQRWTFFLTSAPTNVNGGVGTVANAIAIL